MKAKPRPVQKDHPTENGVMSKTTNETSHPVAVKPKAKKATKRSSKLKYRRPAKMRQPLSTEELINMMETEQQYHTSLLHMQVKELLKEVKLKDKRRNNIDDFLQKISDHIQKIPKTLKKDIVDQTWLPKSVKVPFLQHPFQVQGKFFFQAPSSIKVVGSYLLGTCNKPEINVDVAVTMPQEILQANDHLNQRYLRKRALYLAYIAAHLSECKIFSSVTFTYMNSNHLKPVLLLRPEGKDEKVVTVRIHVCPPPGLFDFKQFYPSKNNVRTAWFQNKNVPDAEETSEPPTPHYNNAVLCDLAMEQHFHHLSSCMSDSPGMKEGISLLKVWLRQRQLDKGCGGLSGFVVSMLVAYLLSRNKINKVMNGHQILRNTLQFIGSTDLTVDGISMANYTDSLPSIKDFHQAFEVVFVDPLGVVNLCAEMTADKYYQIQKEAKESLRVLDDPNINGFLLTLTVPKPFVTTFDHVFHITQLAKLQNTAKKINLVNELQDRGGDYVLATLPFILTLIKKGLNQRLVLISHALPQMPEWDITKEPAKHEDFGCLTVGLMLTPEFFCSVLEKGPAADIPEAEDFRSFWGEKSELRRFADSSICEAVVWPVSSQEEKRCIPELIVKYLLRIHADLPEPAICYVGNLLDSVLTKGKKVDAGEDQMLNAIQSYDDLSRKLWNLKHLPLMVTAVQGTHPALRYTDVFPPVPVKPNWFYYKKACDKTCLVPLLNKPCPAYVSPIKVICHMAGSGKWPQDKDAIKRVKAAFQIRLAELLKKQYKLLCKTNATYTDVFKDGYVFRVHVAYHREPQYMKQFVTSDKMLISRDTKESLQLELQTIHLPHLTSILHGLHQQLPAFGGTSRLAKRWVSAQLLADGISDECVDLLVAYLFLHPLPFTAPSSSQVGFLRFLNLLATYDWKNSPLIVNLDGNMTDADITDIQKYFTSSRAKHPVMSIATSKEKTMSVWTKEKPTAQILQRLIILASESLMTLEKQLMDPLKCNDFKMVFRPPLDLYDVLIHLNPKHIPRHREAVDQPVASFVRGLQEEDVSANCSSFPVVDYDPVQFYLTELKESYGEFALFFYDAHGGEVIGVLWNPSSFTPQPFKMAKVNGRIVDTKSNSLLLIPNVEAILEDFKILGEGLVKSIECQSEKWKI